MKGFLIGIGIIFGTIFIVVAGIGIRWISTFIKNEVQFVDKKIEDRTNYETRKKVEDTARASITSYKTDRTTYETYKDSKNEEEQSWAKQAKMRANKTANIYNEYILKNSFVFEGNIPSDIEYQLEIIR